MLKVLIICVLAASALGRTVPKPCCVPVKFEAVMGMDQAISTAGQPITTTRSTNFLSMDYINKKMAVVVLHQDRSGWTKTISDFANGKQYYIVGAKCTVTPLTFPMQSPCIPENARYLGSSYMGSVTAKIPFDSWSYYLSNYNINVTVSVSQDDCTPLVESIGTRNSDYQSLGVGAFTSFTLGIKDPSVFDPPPQCKQSETKDFHQV